MAALLIGALTTQFEITVVGTAMPAISAELGNPALYTWVFAAYLVAYTAAVPASGMINDSLGRRAAYMLAMSLLVGGTIVCASATSMQMLIVGRVVQGAGAGSLYVSAQTIMGDLFSMEDRAKMQGYLAATLGLGTAIGPGLGALFVSHNAWRWSFLITLPIALVATAIFLYGYRPSAARGQTHRPNWIGALLLTLMLSALLVAFRRDSVNVVLLAVAAAIAVPFLLHERHAARPILDPDLLRMRAFVAAAATLMMLSAVQIATMVFSPLYLQGALGVSPSKAGYLITVPITVTGAVATFTVAKVVKRWGYRTAVRVGAALVLTKTICIAAAVHLQLHTASPFGPTLLVIVAETAQGACLGLTVTAAMICVQNAVPKERRGIATAMLHLFRGIANVLMPAILGLIYMHALGGANPEAVLGKHAGVPPEAIASARASLGEALRTLVWPLLATGIACVLASLAFPREAPPEVKS